MRIGFFDSGIGGVSVAQSAMSNLHRYDYLYFADDTHMPYGNKDKTVLYSLTTQALEKMFQNDCKLIVLACNSASTILPRIQQEWLPQYYPDRKVLGVIRPTVEHMGESDDIRKIYVLATPVTVKSESFDHELKKINIPCSFHEIACPGLAEAIERSTDYTADPKILTLIEKYLQTIPTDVVVEIYTGCTHYAFISPVIQRLRPRAIVHNQGTIVATKLKEYLGRHPEIESYLSQNAGDKNYKINTYCDSGESRYILKLQKTFSFRFDE
jgi:glutamate racemase